MLHLRRETAIPLLAALLVASCSPRKDVEGYKDVRFGLQASDLAKLGFSCARAEGDCVKRSDAPASTLYGIEAKPTPHLDNGKVDKISVMVGMNADEVSALLTKDYGAPKGFTYDGYLGGRFKRTYWTSSNGASVAITRTVSESPASPALIPGMDAFGVRDYINNHTSVDFQDAASTKAMLKEAERYTVNADDS